MILCKKCNIEKEESAFYWRKSGGIYSYSCKSCVMLTQKTAINSWDAERKTEYRNYAREYQRRNAKERNAKRHGLTVERYDRMLEEQNGACAACKRELGELRHTGIDHDHNHCSGHFGCKECVRGILCSNCNLALGHLKDDPDTLLMLYNYLMTRK